MDFQIIDFHAHAFPDKIERKAIENLEKHYNITISMGGRVQDLLSSAQNSGVDYMVVHATATHKSQVQANNDWVASITGDKVIGFGTLHPDYKNCLGELERIKKLGLRGLKFHPDFQDFDIDDPSMYSIYDAIEPEFPLLIHLGDENLDHSSPRRLSKVLEMFPHLTIIGAHLGGYSQWEEAQEHLVGKNLFLDTSSALWRLNPKKATDIIRSHGVNKILFGTDYPIASHYDEWQRFMALPLKDEEREMIAYKNACRILGLDVPQKE